MNCLTRAGSLAALGVVVACAFQAGCSTKACTLIGCGPPFEITFAPSEGEWLSGTYTVAVSSDGTDGSCDVTLPFASCQTTPSCIGIRHWDVIDSGCALQPDKHAISGVVFRAAPMNVEVIVSRDGRQLADGVFTPSYQSSQPNGHGCGDTCYGAPLLPLRCSRERQTDVIACARTQASRGPLGATAPHRGVSRQGDVMTVKRMDNVGIVVEDIDAAIEFFTELGLDSKGAAPSKDDWADGVTGLRGMRVEIAMMRTPDGHSRLELSRFLARRVAPITATPL